MKQGCHFSAHFLPDLSLSQSAPLLGCHQLQNLALLVPTSFIWAKVLLVDTVMQW